MSDDFNPMKMPEFSFRRGAGTVSITPCPDGDESWHWMFVHDNPPATVEVPTGFVDFETGERAMKEVPWTAPVQHASNEQIMTSLSTSELRDLLGFLSHLTEHLMMHVGELMKGMTEAHSSAEWDGLASLNAELDVSLHTRNTAGQLGKLVYDALEHAPTTNDSPVAD